MINRIENTTHLEAIMTIAVKKWTVKEVGSAVRIWNQIVEEGKAFPQTNLLTYEEGKAFFAKQDYTGIAYDTESGAIVGAVSGLLGAWLVLRCTQARCASDRNFRPYIRY